MTSVRLLPILLSAGLLAGCFHVTTESEIKPIHITMDINLKVDKGLEQAFADEAKPAAKTGNFAEIKAMLERQAAGITSEAMLAAREAATDDERILVAEANAKRLQRFASIAKESGVSLVAVQRRYAAKMRERLASGSGVWYQTEDGDWHQK